MAYEIIFSSRAAKQFRKLPKTLRKRIAEPIDGLVDKARPHGVKKPSHQHNLYRLRVGDYRVVYEIKDKQLRILVLVIAGRAEIYKRFL